MLLLEQKIIKNKYSKKIHKLDNGNMKNKTYKVKAI